MANMQDRDGFDYIGRVINLRQRPNFMDQNGAEYQSQAVVMNTHDTDYETTMPDHATLANARAQAQLVKNQNSTDETIEELNNAPNDETIEYVVRSSVQLTQVATEDNTNGKTYFDDFLVAEFYRNALRPLKITHDSTIPKSPEAVKAHVTLLVQAFKSYTDVDDNEGMIRPFREGRHDSKLVECLCWSILKACIHRSKSDEPLLSSFEPTKAKNAIGVDTFAKRFDAIVLAMFRSKTICKHLYDAPYINTFVDDPIRSIRRVDANRDLNKQKAGIMSKGKEIQQKETEENGGVITPRRSARKRNASSARVDEDDDFTEFSSPIPHRSVRPTPDHNSSDMLAPETPPSRRSNRLNPISRSVSATRNPLSSYSPASSPSQGAAGGANATENNGFGPNLRSNGRGDDNDSSSSLGGVKDENESIASSQTSAPNASQVNPSSFGGNQPNNAFHRHVPQSFNGFNYFRPAPPQLPLQFIAQSNIPGVSSLDGRDQFMAINGEAPFWFPALNPAPNQNLAPQHVVAANQAPIHHGIAYGHQVAAQHAALVPDHFYADDDDDDE